MPPSDLRERLAGAVVNRYRLEREIGSGGMATVHLARDLRHDRPVAIKVLNPDLAEVLGAERFLNEILLAVQLAHPHILPVYDSEVADGLYFYVMPYVDGESLRGRLDREQTLDVPEAAEIVRDVADALDYAHSRGVVHRDIKPANVLLADRHAFVTDFGIAQAIADVGRAGIRGTSTALGTLAYISPEQGAGALSLDGRSDVYSLGCVLFEMLVGRPPFAGPESHAVAARRTTDVPGDGDSLENTVPAALRRTLRRALATRREDRFRTAAEFARSVAAAVTVSPRDAGENR